MRDLFEIGEDLTALRDLMTATDGEIPEGEVGEALERFMSSLSDERDEKIRRYCWVIDGLNNNVKSLQEIVEYLQAQIKTQEKAAARLKERMKRFFEDHGIQKLDLVIFKPRIQANGGPLPLEYLPSWEIYPETAPKRFQKVVIELDTKAIREAIRNDEETHGAKLGERGSHFRLR